MNLFRKINTFEHRSYYILPPTLKLKMFCVLSLLVCLCGTINSGNFPKPCKLVALHKANCQCYCHVVNEPLNLIHIDYIFQVVGTIIDFEHCDGFCEHNFSLFYVYDRKLNFSVCGKCHSGQNLLLYPFTYVRFACGNFSAHIHWKTQLTYVL